MISGSKVENVLISAIIYGSNKRTEIKRKWITLQMQNGRSLYFTSEEPEIGKIFPILIVVL
jgi:hypothetical protein